jgi:hypothetical protein
MEAKSHAFIPCPKHRDEVCALRDLFKVLQVNYDNNHPSVLKYL